MSNGGPWGGGGDNRDGRNDGRNDGRPPRRPGGEGPQIPEIDEIVKKGQEQLRVLMGGRGRSGGGGGNGGSGGPGPILSAQGAALGVLALAAVWSWMSFYTVKPEERSVELMLGKFADIGQPGLNFAPWPLVTYEKVAVTSQRTTDVGTGRNGDGDSGLMLTRDQNIVDVAFQVVWNVKNPEDFLFNLADPADTVRAVSASAMRDIIARSELIPVLNTGRASIAADLQANVQETLDEYNAGIQIVRVNFDRADPPREVSDAFREVQAAQQERDRLEKEADAYSNRVTAGARGEAARLLEDAEAYRARVVNDAQGEASRFLAVYGEYVKAPEVTRQRMYLETMENVLGRMNKVILDGVSEGQGGVVPYLPLNELSRPQQPQQGGN